MAKIKDDKYAIIKNDVEKIKHRPTMYISSLGDSGVFHLCKEIIDNNRDECLKKESPGDTIEVDITDKYIWSRDNGRGIPTGILREVLETIQAGTNMTRSSHNATSGENGVGTTCVLAMSSELEVTTLRPQEKKKLTLQYKDGELVSEVLEDYTDKDHGLIMLFKPSRKILGVNTIPVEMLEKWLKDFDYTLPNSIHMTYTIRGEEYTVKHKPLYTYFDEFIPEDSGRMCNTLVINCSRNLKETFMEQEFDRQFTLEAGIVYSDPDGYKGEDLRQSWMNMIHTSQNGSHVDGVIRGFSKYITERIVKKNKKFEDEDLRKDILSHLSVVVKAECDFAHMFSSQAKHTVFSKSLGNAIADAVYESLVSSANNSVVLEMIDVIIGNHRARIEGEKARSINAVTKVKKCWTKPDSFIPHSSVKSEFPKELFIVEGNSAGGGLRAARDARYQAILQCRGKSLNVWDQDIDRVLKEGSKSWPNTWLDLVKILGCGIGPTFNIKKLNYDKIIIATDADIDGYHIRVLICTFFLKYMPEIIYEGRLYISEPPLYQIAKGKDISYVASQTEYIQKCIDGLSDIEISFPEIDVA